MTLFDSDHKAPPPDEADTTHNLVKVALSSVPVLGWAGALVFDQLVVPPVQRRQAEFLNDVAERLRILEEKALIDCATLPQNDAFNDALLTAMNAVTRTSQSAKRQAFRNAVLNAALPQGPDLVHQQYFLSLVDRFTDLHILLLRLFSDPAKWPTPLNLPGGADGSTLAKVALPDYLSLLVPAWEDLRSAGLGSTPMNNGMEGPDIRTVKRTTPMGDALLAFITEPQDAKCPRSD